MKKVSFVVSAVVACSLLIAATGNLRAQDAAAAAPTAAGSMAHMLVTVEARKGTDVPDVSRADVMVYEGHDRDQVTDWTPAQGDNAALELYILLDDGSGINLGTQLEDIKRFITAQPSSTKIGLAYMQDGRAKVQQNLTTDHDAVAKALRLPMGIPGVNASPYFSLSDLVKRWPESKARREVLMVTDGVDRYYGGNDLEDPYLTTAIDDAQRAGILVYGIYTPGAGHFGHSSWQNYWGQIYLAHLTEDSGGESYYIGFSGAPVNFRPYLEDLDRHLNHQYWLAFAPKPQKKNGWQRVKVSTEVSNGELVAPRQVYVTATPR
jgi:hypothetical protein